MCRVLKITQYALKKMHIVRKLKWRLVTGCLAFCWAASFRRNSKGTSGNVQGEPLREIANSCKNSE